MGAIKDLVDLAKDLESRAKDRRDIDLVHKIQSLAFSIQSQHAEIVERDVGLMQENAELKKQLAESQAEDVCIHRGVEFRRGKRTRDKWMAFCPKCHMPAENAQMIRTRNKIVACTARCGWQVFMDSKLEDLVSEIAG